MVAVCTRTPSNRRYATGRKDDILTTKEMTSRKMLGSLRKLAHISNSVRRIQKSWFRVLKIVWGGVRRMKKKKKRRKNGKCSDRNENWYQDQIRCDKFKNHGPEF